MLKLEISLNKKQMSKQCFKLEGHIHLIYHLLVALLLHWMLAKTAKTSKFPDDLSLLSSGCCQHIKAFIVSHTYTDIQKACIRHITGKSSLCFSLGLVPDECFSQLKLNTSVKTLPITLFRVIICINTCTVYT